MSVLRVKGLATRSLSNPMAGNSLIITVDERVYWQGREIGKVNTDKWVLRVGFMYRSCTMLISGTPVRFGNDNSKVYTFRFLGETLTMFSFETEATYDPENQNLVVY